MIFYIYRPPIKHDLAERILVVASHLPVVLPVSRSLKWFPRHNL